MALIEKNITPENYLIDNETFVCVSKDKKADKIEVEIGDIKQRDFKPQFKFKRWDNEVNFSMRAEEHKDAIVETEGEKIKYITPDYEVHQYDKPDAGEDGGFEFEWVLPQKPKTNILTATLETKELDFFYQDVLSDEEIKDGAERPDNIIGSYAVYHKTKKDNRIGGKEYKTGKAFHIYRPQAIDAKGEKVWCELNIDKDLTVTVSQDFLDNAIYPVTVDPTFGYTSIGASSDNHAPDLLLGSLFTTPGTGSIDSITFYDSTTVASGENKAVIVDSSKNILTNGVSNITSDGVGGMWKTATYTTSPIIYTSSDYYLMKIHEAGFYSNLYYDTGVTNQSLEDTSNSFSSPTNPTDGSSGTNKYSIYATYTSSDLVDTETATFTELTPTVSGNADLLHRLATQSGTTSIPNGSTSIDETLTTNITDLSRAFIVMQTSGDNGANLGSEHQATGYLWNDGGTTKIKFERNASTDDCQISYYVVETKNEDFTVQRGSVSLVSVGTNTDDFTTAITQSRSMIISNSRSSNLASEGFAIGQFSDNDTVSFTRNDISGTCTVRYEVVEWSTESGVSVYTGEQDLSGLIASGVTTDITSHGITKANTWMFATFRHSSNGLEQTAICTDLTSDTAITWQRYDQATSYTSTGRYWLIEFPSDVSVQHSGAVAAASTDFTEDYTITAINEDRAWADHYNSCNGTGTAFPRTKWIDYFTSTTTLRAQRYYNGQAAEMAFQVIDVNDWTYTTTPPEGGSLINIGDDFKDIVGMQINIGDSWKTVTAVKINVGDTWKDVTL